MSGNGRLELDMAGLDGPELVEEIRSLRKRLKKTDLILGDVLAFFPAVKTRGDLVMQLTRVMDERSENLALKAEVADLQRRCKKLSDVHLASLEVLSPCANLRIDRISARSLVLASIILNRWRRTAGEPSNAVGIRRNWMFFEPRASQAAEEEDSSDREALLEELAHERAQNEKLREQLVNTKQLLECLQSSKEESLHESLRKELEEERRAREEVSRQIEERDAVIAEMEQRFSIQLGESEEREEQMAEKIGRLEKENGRLRELNRLFERREKSGVKEQLALERKVSLQSGMLRRGKEDLAVLCIENDHLFRTVHNLQKSPTEDHWMKTLF